MPAGTNDEADVSIVVPAYNEEATIKEVVQRLLALTIPTQIVVVNDGSTDNTPHVLQEFEDQVVVVTNKTPTGKGSAIRAGLPHCTGKVVVIQDADLEYSPEDIPLVVGPILAGLTKVSYGTRFSKGMHPSMALPNKIVNVLLRWMVAFLFWRRLTDEATCYKAIDRDLLARMDLKCKRFEFCPEVTAKAYVLGQQIVEVPIRYEPRTKAAGKKIRWTDAPDAFWTLLKYRFWRPRK